MNNSTKNTKSVNEFLQELSKKRQAEKHTEDEQNGPMVEPIICNGVADIVVTEEEKER